MPWWGWFAIVVAIAAGIAGNKIFANPAPPPDAKERLLQLDRMMGAARNVYFEEIGTEVNLMWFVLRRSPYYSCVQASGVMFYEKTAAEYRRRATALRELNLNGFGGFCWPRANADWHGPTGIWQLIEVCQRLPDLDMLFLLTKVPDYDPPSWKAPAYQWQYDPQLKNSVKVDTWYEYDCRKLRKNS